MILIFNIGIKAYFSIMSDIDPNHFALGNHLGISACLLTHKKCDFTLWWPTYSRICFITFIISRLFLQW